MLSVTQLNNSGYRVEFQNRKSKIYDATRKLIESGEKTRGNLFYLDLYDDTCIFT